MYCVGCYRPALSRCEVARTVYTADSNLLGLCAGRYCIRCFVISTSRTYRISFPYVVALQQRMVLRRQHVRRSAVSVWKGRSSLPQCQVGVRVQQDQRKQGGHWPRPLAGVPRPPASHLAERQFRHWLLCRRQHK